MSDSMRYNYVLNQPAFGGSSMPYHFLMDKFAETDMPDEEEYYNNFARSTLADRTPDTATFESEQPRRPDSNGTLNLRHGGHRGSAEWGHPEAFFDEFFADPRSNTTGPNISLYAGQQAFRANRYKNFQANTNHASITGGGVSESQVRDARNQAWQTWGAQARIFSRNRPGIQRRSNNTVFRPSNLRHTTAPDVKDATTTAKTVRSRASAPSRDSRQEWFARQQHSQPRRAEDAPAQNSHLKIPGNPRNAQNNAQAVTTKFERETANVRQNHGGIRQVRDTVSQQEFAVGSESAIRLNGGGVPHHYRPADVVVQGNFVESVRSALRGIREHKPEVNWRSIDDAMRVRGFNAERIRGLMVNYRGANRDNVSDVRRVERAEDAVWSRGGRLQAPGRVVDTQGDAYLQGLQSVGVSYKSAGWGSGMMGRVNVVEQGRAAQMRPTMVRSSAVNLADVTMRESLVTNEFGSNRGAVPNMGMMGDKSRVRRYVDSDLDYGEKMLS